MQRQIKFRSWSNKLKSWVKSIVVSENGSPFIVFVEVNEAERTFINHIYTADDQELVIQQFTGLFDKNNKEIYEGDFVKIGEEWSTHIPIAKDAIEIWSHPSDAKSGWCWMGLEGRVVFDSGCFMVYPINNKEVRFFPLFERVYKIIGNIFENPELLQ